MLIESRTIVGAAAAFAIVGAGLWASTFLASNPQPQPGSSVEVQQVQERSWAVEVKDLSAQPAPSDATKTAAVTQ